LYIPERIIPPTTSFADPLVGAWRLAERDKYHAIAWNVKNITFFDQPA
jgi:hypothetical protein